MNMPGFTADRAHSRSARAVDQASCKDTSWQFSVAQRFDAGNNVRPARMSEQQREYRDCIQECRQEAGPDRSACLADCRRIGTPPGYGPPGTSEATVLCCLEKFGLCLALGGWTWTTIVSCSAQIWDCATTPPCRDAQ